MTAAVEFDFNTPWERKDGRIVRWRQAEPKQFFMGLRVRLEERRGESVEMEFPPGTHPSVILSELGKMRAEFLSRPRIRATKDDRKQGKSQKGQQTNAA